MNSNQEEKPKLDDVHSANSWETADLGDKSRNEKFLRLMGAAKKEHHGRFVIGDKDPSHVRPKNEDRHVEEELEEQYEHSMEHRLAGGRKGHIGLGFHDEAEKDKKEEEKKEDEEKEDEDDNDDTKEKEESPSKDEDLSEKKETDNDESRKRESLDKAGPEDEKVKKMKFVKSSS